MCPSKSKKKGKEEKRGKKFKRGQKWGKDRTNGLGLKGKMMKHDRKRGKRCKKGNNKENLGKQKKQGKKSRTIFETGKNNQ